jgi:hypothetical protein
MAEIKECPLCGERMRIVVRTITDRIPGQSQAVTKESREWVCPDCDYFEEYDADEDQASALR